MYMTDPLKNTSARMLNPTHFPGSTNSTSRLPRSRPCTSATYPHGLPTASQQNLVKNYLIEKQLIRLTFPSTNQNLVLNPLSGTSAVVGGNQNNFSGNQTIMVTSPCVTAVNQNIIPGKAYFMSGVQANVPDNHQTIISGSQRVISNQAIRLGNEQFVLGYNNSSNILPQPVVITRNQDPRSAHQEILLHSNAPSYGLLDQTVVNSLPRQIVGTAGNQNVILGNNAASLNLENQITNKPPQASTSVSGNDGTFVVPSTLRIGNRHIVVQPAPVTTPNLHWSNTGTLDRSTLSLGQLAALNENPMLKMKYAPTKYVNPFDYTPYEKFQANHNKTIPSGVQYPSKPTAPTFPCMICADVKKDKASLLEHYEYHKKEKEQNANVQGEEMDFLECPVCRTRYYNLTSYERHVEEAHKEKEFYCDICKRQFASPYTLCIHNRDKHLQNPNTFTCCLCKRFSTSAAQKLRKHISLKHEKKMEHYNCIECGKDFTSKSWFNDHKIFHVQNELHECKPCKKSFKLHRLLVAHNNKFHHNDNLLVKLECKVCNQTFATTQAQERHLGVHTEEEHLCQICGKKFNSKGKLSVHTKIHSKTYVCTICGNKFSKSQILKVHMRTHTGEKPHKCGTCGKCFSQRSPLVIHQRYHTGERPYKCSRCDKGFVSKSAKEIHAKTCKYCPESE